MKNSVKIALFIPVLIVSIIALMYFFLDQEMPNGNEGVQADNFALKIQKALRHDNFLSTDYLQWSFREEHHYLWAKKQNTVRVHWEDYTVMLQLDVPDASRVKQGTTTITGAEKQELIQTALAYFHNDSFWAIAPYKLFDQGVKRQLVTLDNQEKSLLVTYSSGGTTPGDSYLWKVDENYIPTSYQMWVAILPVGGLEVSWENWITTESGIAIAQTHTLLGMDIAITNVKGWNG